MMEEEKKNLSNMKRPGDFENPTEGLEAKENAGAPLTEDALDMVGGGIQGTGPKYCPLCRCTHTLPPGLHYQLQYGPYVLYAMKHTCPYKGDFYHATLNGKDLYFDASLEEI